MDLRRRFFGYSGDRDRQNRVRIDLDLLLQRLLLFDTYILRSIRLYEVPELVATFGYEPALALLQDDALQLHCDSVSIMHTREQTEIKRISNDVVRLSRLAFGIGSIDRQGLLDESYRRLNLPLLPPQQRLRLIDVVNHKLMPRPENSGRPAFNQFNLDLESNAPSIRVAASQRVTGRLGWRVDPAEIVLRFYCQRGAAFEVETNLPRFGIQPHEIVDIASSVALAIASLNEKVEHMARLNAMVGMFPGDLPVFTEKLAFVARSLDPSIQASRFERVIDVTDLPHLLANSVDLTRFLDIRRSREAQEFRSWLWSIDSLSSEQLDELLKDVRAKLAAWSNTKRGKVLRWVATNGLGLLPAGSLLGGVADLLDSFLLERLLPESGVVTFLGVEYPSIFTQGPPNSA